MVYLRIRMCDRCGYVARTPSSPGSCLEARDALFFRTFELSRPPFVHQLAVDAYGAQHLTDASPKIAKLFTLMGLCMVTERDATGYEVQMAHMAKSKDRDRPDWPNLPIRPRRFVMNVGDVLNTEPLEPALRSWVEATWEAFADVHAEVRAFCESVRR